MAHLISFATMRFDIAVETPHPINPVAGKSIYMWLWQKLAAYSYEATEPEAEDWGCYVDVHRPGASYFVGTRADLGPASPRE